MTYLYSNNDSQKCVLLDDMTHAELLFERALSRSLRADTSLFNLLLRGYSRRGDAAAIDQLRERMRDARATLDSESFGFIVHAYARAARGADALDAIELLKRSGLKATSTIWNGLLLGHAARDDGDAMLATLERMKLDGVDADAHTYDLLIRLTAKHDNVEGGSNHCCLLLVLRSVTFFSRSGRHA